MKPLIIIPLVVILTMLFSWAIIRGIDISIQNQDTMLCESAQKSLNAEYLRKCKCYYQMGDIRCLQKGY